jgi:hypothetical protein
LSDALVEGRDLLFLLDQFRAKSRPVDLLFNRGRPIFETPQDTVERGEFGFDAIKFSVDGVKVRKRFGAQRKGPDTIIVPCRGSRSSCENGSTR